MQAETINSSKNYWSNEGEPSTKKPRVAEATSTVEITTPPILSNQSSGSDFKEVTNASTSPESACSSTHPDTCPFSSSTDTPSTSTSVHALDCATGHQTFARGKHDAESPVDVESPATSEEISPDDVMAALGCLHVELQTESPEMPSELEALNKIMSGNEPACRHYLVLMCNLL